MWYSPVSENPLSRKQFVALHTDFKLTDATIFPRPLLYKNLGYLYKPDRPA